MEAADPDGTKYGNTIKNYINEGFTSVDDYGLGVKYVSDEEGTISLNLSLIHI